ncbi:MAG: hypothetical protein NXH75_08525, partial [Halobacteriovoraceae bacterium]|nr:hypothetical protein [Halobacteriovoraceae bacterium]
MSSLKKKLLILSVVIFAVFRLSLLFTDTVIWPFWNYSMFAQLYGNKLSLVSVRLTQDNGASIETLSNRIYPIEVFRTFPLHDSVFFGDESFNRQKFLEIVLDHINDKPWRGFDVILSPPQASTGQR